MITKLLESRLLTEWVQVLGHSIWIGAISALVYFFYIKSSHRLTPSDRVNRGMILMGSLPLLSLFFTIGEDFLIPFPTSISLVIPYYLILWLGGLWLFGFSLYAIRLAAGLCKLHRLKNSCEEPAPCELRQLDEIRQKLNAPQNLPVRTTDLVPGPMLCGLLRPVIIIPQKLLQKADRKCLEPILAHEIAHYLRKDLWINLCQSIIEVLFFFHPAVRWISREIRLEREKACDDHAVIRLNGNRFAYASALLETESSATYNGLATAFSNESTSDRAARIAFGERHEKLPFSGTLSILSLAIVILTAWSIFSIVKLSRTTFEIPEGSQTTIIYEDRFPVINFANILNFKDEWNDKRIGDRAIPLIKSIPIVERDGILYDLTKDQPRLFPTLPNSWLLENNLDYLKRDLPGTDPDGDLFTVIEEFNAGTDPKDKLSHPDRVLLLGYVARHFELYRVKYAARTDNTTVQLTRIPTTKHPVRESFFLQADGISPDSRFRLKEIESDTVLLEDLETGIEHLVKKQSAADFITYYAEFSVRGGDHLFVKEGTNFYIPGGDHPGARETKWKLLHVTENECGVAGPEKSFTLPLRP